MTYYGIVLLMSGYQADEKYILQQYRAIVGKCVHLHPCMLQLLLKTSNMQT
jgi:hypothetical protein